MMETPRDDRSCERARAWVSLDLDGELSQLEGALLAAHLRRCEACAAAAATMRAVTDALRAAPLEAPASPVSVLAKEKPRHLAVRLALAATLAALAAGLGIVAGSIDRGGDAPAGPTDGDIALLPTPSPDDRRDFQRIRPRDGGPEDAVPPRLGGV